MTRVARPIDEAFKNRKSLHVLSDDIDTPDSRIEEIVRNAILHSPSAFNCQSGRAVVLLKDEHKKLWDIARDVAKATVPPEVFANAFEPRVKMFRAAYGSILFFDSGEALKAIENKMPIVKDKIPQWSEHANGMLQFAVWTMLTAEGLGVNLQHYNPMIDSEVAKQWNIPTDWKLKAQMVFGKVAGPRLREKPYEPVEDRMKVFGA